MSSTTGTLTRLLERTTMFKHVIIAIHSTIYVGMKSWTEHNVTKSPLSFQNYLTKYIEVQLNFTFQFSYTIDPPIQYQKFIRS